MLFADSQVMGTFKGFNEKGLEFAAEIVAPYDVSMLERPQLGQFILIELASEEEASLGRITKFVPSGLLATAEGEDYVNTMQRRKQAVPEDLKQQRLKYRVQVKLLGAVKVVEKKIIYVPSQRRLPHLGAKVALPSPAVLRELCKLSQGTTELGDYVLGEFVYCGSNIPQEHIAMRSMDPRLEVMFDIKNLVAKRSVVFARAGYGKSNLIKFLVAELYKDQPRTERGLPVGTLIFDADGEYFWPDDVKGRPGLCDVPHLRDKIIVFTNRPALSQYYNSWKAGEVKLDIRELPARDVIGIAVSSERQTQQNVLKLKSISDPNWRQLVDLIDSQGLQASDQVVGTLLGYTPAQAQNSLAEIAAAKSNMFAVVRTLHDPNSNVLSLALQALQRGSIVILDISLLSATAGNMVAGLLMRRIFSNNQINFTNRGGIVPVVAIIEEAQSVLNKNLEETSPFVEWVKEGRKYDLGAMLVTQQPASLASEILSQADNWFTFHLLSEGDAGTLGKYNAHFSDDILAHLISEPIPGNCYMWSAPHQPFVLPVRVRSFEGLYKKEVDTDPNKAAIQNSPGAKLVEEFETSLKKMKDVLVDDLKSSATKYYQLPEKFKLKKGSPAFGVWGSQLYHLVKKAKMADPTATMTENQLKKPLMSVVLGADILEIIDADGSDYYCASMEIWENLLGKKLSLSPWRT